MIIFKKVPNFDFMGKAHIFGGISVLVVIFSLAMVAVKGLHYGIDFAGGIEIQVQFPNKPNSADVRSALEKEGIKDATVIHSEGETEDYLISMLGKSEEANALSAHVKSALEKEFGVQNVIIRRVDAVGAKVGKDLKKAGLYSVFYTLIGILVYIWFRFNIIFAPGAVLCLAHDGLIILGIFSLMGKEFNLTILAAILTILGYSLNDTVVVFDRIRETLEKGTFAGNLPKIINLSINETLGRTLLTAFATFLTVLALYLKGGGIIHDFAFALGIGMIFGTYSSIFVAAPLMIVTQKFIDSRNAVSLKRR